MTLPRTYTPLPTPDTGVTALPTAYQPKRKAFFLSQMIRAAQSSKLAGMSVEPGNIWHRLLSIFAEQLERFSFMSAEIAVWAIREGAYQAWHDPQLFPARRGKTYAFGTLIFTPLSPTLADSLIPAGTLISAPDGRAVTVVRDTIFPAGDTRAEVQVSSTIPGSAGRIEAGQLQQFYGGSVRFSVNNPAPITGGSDGESDDQLYARFQDYVESRSTGNRLAVYSAAKNASFTSGPLTEQVSDVALIYPWATTALNGEMGVGYVIIDNGSADASSSLIAAAQANVDRVQSIMERNIVMSASAYVLPLSLRVYATRTADPLALRSAVQQVWSDYGDSFKIEDGQGRGRVSLYELSQRLDRAHPDLLAAEILNLEGDIIPPLGARAVAGTLNLDLRRGEVVRP